MLSGMSRLTNLMLVVMLAVFAHAYFDALRSSSLPSAWLNPQGWLALGWSILLLVMTGWLLTATWLEYSPPSRKYWYLFLPDPVATVIRTACSLACVLLFAGVIVSFFSLCH